MPWNIKDLEERLLIGSTLVEGSTLTEAEAREVLSGRTVVGHSVNELRELLNYRAALEWFMKKVQESPSVTSNVILQFHKKLFDGFQGTHGRWKVNPNFTYRSDGSRHPYVKSVKIPSAISEWLEYFNGNIGQEAAAKRASKLYYEFENIHPFEDGNGRIGRILISYWLHWKHGLRLSFYKKDKVEHLKALEDANTGKLDLLETFFTRRIAKEKE